VPPSTPADRGAPSATTSTALLTDRYELTMLDAALHDGTALRPSVFEVFARRLPPGRRFGVVAGVARVVEALAAFRFDDEVLRWLDQERIVRPETIRWLGDLRFSGDVHAYREGEILVDGSPVMTVVATFGEALLIETLVLSILNHDAAVAAAAARMVGAARGRRLLEFGSRRTHEEAAVAAARAAYLVGFDATSNLEAGRRYGIPTSGTTGHAFVLVHDDEPSAFVSQIESAGPATTLLVDTYASEVGIRNALAAAGPELGAIRIDSGDLVEETRRARAQLDAAGATGTRIVVSGDLDEFSIERLADSPVDAYGVGTSLVTGSGAPTAGFVYKLVARATTPGGTLEPVAKGGGAKATVGSWKVASRELADGNATRELLRPAGTARPAGSRALQVPVITAGEPVPLGTLEEARAHHLAAIAELPPDARDLTPGDPCIPTAHLETTRPGTVDLEAHHAPR
jgi:nicotinate phosphoribosyltransferase